MGFKFRNIKRAMQIVWFFFYCLLAACTYTRRVYIMFTCRVYAYLPRVRLPAACTLTCRVYVYLLRVCLLAACTTY